MKVKVKSILKLIEEIQIFLQRGQRCFSFTKRHDLMNLVEGFYMAHIALPERCSHISGKFHSANSTIASVFPKPFAMAELDSPSNPSPTNKTPQLVCLI
ncbi:hypothetical protein AMTRI_Chr11g94100 [Amborella trichopoda]